jgi:hypothetical protein
MTTLVLDANNPGHVESAKVLDVLIGIPNRHMLIFTGIAKPGWDSQSDLDRELVVVKLGKPATALIGYTATVGLASVSNDDSDFVFATDDVTVGIDTALQLELRCNVAVQGEPSVLNRFSYQANVIVDLDEPLIAGTIRWSPDIAQANRPNHLCLIEAFVHTDDGSLGGVDQVVAQAEESGPASFSGARWEVPYVIRGIPLNTTLRVRASMQAGAFSPTSINSQLGMSPGFSGPYTLTFQQLKATGVDFEVTGSRPPR